jgi:peptide-methionine (R)-S-oxide reductase
MNSSTNPTMKFPLQRTEAEWRKILTPEQYHVLREAGTERAFTGKYWNTKEPGIYRCAACGEILFKSDDKFDSGCGWPSFSRPLATNDVVERTDRSLGMERTEVRSGAADSHLGHVFNDGPGPTGLRYCINSASLRFIPVEEMERAGYGAYLEPFIKAGLYKPKDPQSVEASKR